LPAVWTTLTQFATHMAVFFGYAQIIMKVIYNMTFWHVQATTVAMEMQQCLLFA